MTDQTTFFDQRPTHNPIPATVTKLEDLARSLWLEHDRTIEQYLAGEISQACMALETERLGEQALEAERQLKIARKQAQCTHDFQPERAPGNDPETEIWVCCICGFNPDDPTRDLPLLKG